MRVTNVDVTVVEVPQSHRYALANDTTYYGLEDDVITERLEIDSGKIALPQKPGLGIEGDPERVKRSALDR